MRRRGIGGGVLAAVLLALGTAGCGGDAPARATAPGALAIGDPVDVLHLLDAEGRPYERSPGADGKVTVIWFWSTLCRCVRECEDRIRALQERFPADRLELFAVDANPDDTPEAIEALRARLASTYPVYRDDRGRTARRLGIEASASVAVLDGRGRLRYRGAIDDSLYTPTISYVEQAVEALLAGRRITTTEVVSYGCMYPADDGDP